MIRIYFLFSIILLTACQQTGKKTATKSSLFSDGLLLDKTTVIYFLNSECPICQKYQGSFKETYQKYNQFFRFYYVFSGHHTEQSIKDFCNYDSIPFKNAVMDEEGHIAETMGAKVTPQVLITSLQQEHGYLYSGKIDDRFESIGSSKPKATVNYIENALNSLRKNEAIEIS